MEMGLPSKRTRTLVLKGLGGEIAYDDPAIEMSPLSQPITLDGVTVAARIYRFRGSIPLWLLEVVDQEGGATVWDTLFATDRDALRELFVTIKTEGIRTFLEARETLH